MSFLPFFDWCQRTAIAVFIRNSLWAAPVIDVLHLIGLAMLFGPVLILNLRLMGLSLSSQPAAEVAASVHPWFWRGLALSFFSGFFFFVGNAIKAYNVPPFYVKMALLAVGITLQTTLIPAAVGWGRAKAAVTAVVSLAVWILVPIAGFWIELF